MKDHEVMVNMVWITRPERQKAANDEVYRPEGPQARSRGLGAPKPRSNTFILSDKEFYTAIS